MVDTDGVTGDYLSPLNECSGVRRGQKVLTVHPRKAHACAAC